MKKCPKCGNEYADTTTLCPADGLALEQTSDSLIGQTLAGKYRIDEVLSEGGMGKVYRGTHVLMDKTVAIKVMRPALAADEKIVARFSREARAASRISHPHAISVTDFGEDDGRVFLVMEYLQGRTLKEIIRSEGPMTLPRVIEIVRQVGGALEAAHAEGVVHRDLKSDNIMLLTGVGGDYAKVLDFGIAKINEPEGGYDTELTAPNLVIGTPQYMSPEQCSHSTTIDTRSDIYSLGIILYEMLVGHVPFASGSPTTVMLKQMEERPPSVLAEREELPEAVGKVVAKALEKRPEDRYQRAEELVADLTTAAGVGAPSTRTATTPSGTHRKLQQEDQPDEETIVRPRIEQVVPRASYTIHNEPPPARPFNPWKVLIPAAAAVLVIFTVIYAFTRNTQTPGASPEGSSLVADPNSKPVEPAQPATGKGEEGIPAGGAVAQPSTNANANVNANANANASVNPEIGPSPNASVAVEENANNNANSNSNTNANRKAPPVPSATRPVNVNEPPPPPPSPAATKTPESQATPARSDPTPTS